MNAMQEWTSELPVMQQTVLLTAIRGPDGMQKYCAIKYLLRWYRRCILISALDKKVLADPFDINGGSFTGPSVDDRPDGEWEHPMEAIVDEYLKDLDGIPHHFQLHFMHAAEIIGYKHPDGRIKTWWRHVYFRLVHDMHVHPETEEEMDSRLGDTREGWLARADKATQA